MKRLICVAATIGALVQGCATSAPVVAHLGAGDTPHAVPISTASAEIGPGKQMPFVEGHPLTSVVVTQCNLVVAVYMTMPDGRLLRFDKSANVPAEDLVTIAYTATRSERVEVACEGMGAAGYETHGGTT